MKRLAPFKIIVGEEVLTNRGEIIGLFLEKEIPPHRSPEETIFFIKDQGGLVCIPHPFDRFRPHSKIHKKALVSILDSIDLVEVANSRTYLKRDSRHALRLADNLDVPQIAGSDAHVVREIGKTYIEMPDFENAEQFCESLRQGRIFSHKTGAFIHFYNIRNRLIKRIDRGS
jgi:hypothetical protein